MSHATKYHAVHDGKGATNESIYPKVSAMTSSSCDVTGQFVFPGNMA